MVLCCLCCLNNGPGHMGVQSHEHHTTPHTPCACPRQLQHAERLMDKTRGHGNMFGDEGVPRRDSACASRTAAELVALALMNMLVTAETGVDRSSTGLAKEARGKQGKEADSQRSRDRDGLTHRYEPHL